MGILSGGKVQHRVATYPVDRQMARRNRALNALDRGFGVCGTWVDTPYIDYTDWWWSLENKGTQGVLRMWSNTHELASGYEMMHHVEVSHGYSFWTTEQHVLIAVDNFYELSGALLLLSMDHCTNPIFFNPL